MSAAKKEKKLLRVRQIRSGIGFNKKQKATLTALGLSKIGREVVVPDNPMIRGMIFKVVHLVTVEEDVSTGKA
jgi:large subunit ribosomal protein L30